jgi:heptosyltransferase I
MLYCRFPCLTIEKYETIRYASTMEFRKVLILRLSAVGDVIRTLPAVKAFKEHYPSSHISWVVEESAESLLKGQREIDEVILFPRKRWSQGLKSPLGGWRVLREVFGFAKHLRKQRYDVVLDFHGILKSGLISYFSGTPTRVGFDRKSTKEWNFLFSNRKVQLPGEEISRFERNFALLRGIGLEEKGMTPTRYIHIPRGDQEQVDSFFSRFNPALARPMLAVHPGTSPQTLFKRWMSDRYAQLSDRLVRELKATVIFTWGPEEGELVKTIQSQMKETSVLGPRTESLTQLGAVFRRCDLYIGGDTGPMHMASLVGTPVVAIFGPTDPVANRPLGRHRLVREQVDCNPCRDRSCEERRCLRVVSVDDVFQAVRESLESPTGPEKG